jgi:hypothetical protein
MQWSVITRLLGELEGSLLCFGNGSRVGLRQRRCTNPRIRFPSTCGSYFEFLCSELATAGMGLHAKRRAVPS